MSGEISDFIVPASIVVGVSTIAHSTLAYMCARRRAVRSYVAAVALIWVAVMLANLIATSPSPVTKSILTDWRATLVEIVATIPIVWLPPIVLYYRVSGATTFGYIPAISFVLSVVALPVGFFATLMTSCLFGACL